MAVGVEVEVMSAEVEPCSAESSEVEATGEEAAGADSTGAEVSTALLTGKEVVEVTVERAGQLVMLAAQEVMVTSWVW